MRMKTLKALVELIVLLADPVIRLVTVLRGGRDEAHNTRDEKDNADSGALHRDEE